MTNFQTLFRQISGGQIVSREDFSNNVPQHVGGSGDFGSGWYAINSHPHYPTHTFMGNELVEIPTAKVDFFSKYPYSK